MLSVISRITMFEHLDTTSTELHPLSTANHLASPYTAEDQGAIAGNQKHQEQVHPQGCIARQQSLYWTANMFYSLSV